jgi:acetyl-CoA decarbonylase/synthase complex subunit gamma
MRRKTFTLRERAVLIPVELVAALKTALYMTPVLLLLAGLGGPGSYWTNVVHYGLFAVLALILAIVAGTIVVPLLLPWLPGRAFSVKGLLPGVAAVGALLVFRSGEIGSWPGILEIAGWSLLVLAVTSYLAMNFTGASTYTSLSGVRKEMRYAVPCQIVAAACGMVTWLWSRLAA